MNSAGFVVSFLLEYASAAVRPSISIIAKAIVVVEAIASTKGLGRILGKLLSLAFPSTSAMGLAGPPIRGRRSAVSLAMLVDEDRLGSKESCAARSDEINSFILLLPCPVVLTMESWRESS
ncbi:hypothetical protein C8J56DRAFT_461849 [Mycena floridula]|nr:hypothetical protein C8J56DRAFT_461849 [Mycena floridula]